MFSKTMGTFLPNPTSFYSKTNQNNTLRYSAKVSSLDPLRNDTFSKSLRIPSANIFSVKFGETSIKEIPCFNLKDLKKSLENVKNDPVRRLEIGKPLLEALNECGAIRIENHGVSQQIVEKVLSNIPRILGKPLQELEQFVAKEIPTSFRGLQVIKNDAKRLWSLGAHHNVSMKGNQELTEDGLALFNELNDVSKDMMEVLSLIYEGKPDGILNKFLFQNAVNTPNAIFQDATMRQIYYPSETELKQDGISIEDQISGNKVRLRPHLDYGVITVLPASKEEGLYILPHSLGKGIESEDTVRNIPLNRWIKVKTKPGDLLIQIGRQMDLATRGMDYPISATWHTVLANDHEMKKPRSSTAFFVENQSDPIPDYAKTLSANQHVTATYQFPGKAPFEVSSLYKLMLEKWLAEDPPNQKAFDANGKPVSEKTMIELYTDLNNTVQAAVNNNTNLIYTP